MEGVKLYGNAEVDYDKYLRNNNEGTISKEVSETGFYQRLPRLTITHNYCGTVLTELVPEWYVVNPKTDIKFSNPEVLTDCKFSLAAGNAALDGYAGIPCVPFNCTAAKAGCCDVMLTFFTATPMVEKQTIAMVADATQALLEMILFTRRQRHLPSTSRMANLL